MAKKWHKQTLRLASNRDWGSKPGNKILVIDRGAVRLDYPGDWVFVPGESSAKLYDRQPPDDNCLLELSVIYLPPGVDWTGLPLTAQLEAAMPRGDPEEIDRDEIVSSKRRDLEIAWLERRFTDSTEHRPARSRVCVARGGDIQILITFNFWPEDAPRLSPVWDEALRSLRMGEYMALPVERGGN